MAVIYSLSDLILGTTTSSQLPSGKAIFPSDLNSKYYMMLNFCEYQRENLNQVGTAYTVDSIRLPIPNNLMDGYSVEYGEEEIGTAAGAAFNGSSILGPLSGVVGGALGSAAGAAVSAGISNVLSQGGPGAVSGASSAASLASISLGKTSNPFMTVMFKNPKYKTYEFSWRLHPRNSAESQQLKNIVNAVKYHMLPDRSSGLGGAGGAVLSYPSLVRCQIIAGDSELYPFKYGVVRDCAFNYAPDGVPSFYKNSKGAPSAIDLKIGIEEVEYFLKSSMGSSI
jgi:hypothetical protein